MLHLKDLGIRDVVFLLKNTPDHFNIKLFDWQTQEKKSNSRCLEQKHAYIFQYHPIKKIPKLNLDLISEL